MPIPNHISIIFSFSSIFAALVLSIYLLGKRELRLLGLISTLSFAFSIFLYNHASTLMLFRFETSYHTTNILLALSALFWLHFSVSLAKYEDPWRKRIIGSIYSITSLAITLYLVDLPPIKAPNFAAIILLSLLIFMSSVSIKILYGLALNLPKHLRFQLYSFALINLSNILSATVRFSAHNYNLGRQNHPVLLSVFLLFNISILYFALLRNTAIKYLPNISHNLFELNNNLIIILDKNANIINYNHIARDFLSEITGNPIGQNIYKLIPELPSKAEHFKDEAVYIFSTNLSSLQIYADISFYPIKTLGFSAYLLEIKDVSSHVLDYKQIEQLSNFQQALLDLTNQATETTGFSEHFYQQVLEHAVNIIHDADRASVLLLQRDGKFAYVATKGYDLEKLANFRFTKDQVFFGEYSQKKALVVKRHNNGYYRSNLTEEQNEILDLAIPDMAKTKATLAIPIYINGQLHAVFSLDSFHSYDAFSIEMQNIAEIFANRITDFLHRSYLNKRFLKEAGLKILLSKFQNRLGSVEIDIKVFPRIAKMLLGSMDLSIDQVALLDIEQYDNIVRYGFDHKARLKRNLSEIKSAELMQYISEVKTKHELAHLPDIGFENSFGKSILIYPITNETKLISIVIISSKKRYAFDSEEVEFLESFFSWLETTLNKQLNKKRISLMSAFRKALFSISDEVLSREPDSSFYQRLLENAVSIIPDVEKGSVLLKKNDERFHFDAAVGFDIETLKDVSFSLPDFPFDYNDPTKTSFIVKNLGKIVADSQNKKDHETLKQAGDLELIKTTLYIPIRLSGELKGFFCLDSLINEYIDKGSIEMAQLLGIQVANMLQRYETLHLAQEQSRRYQQLYKEAKRQTARLALLTEIRTNVSDVSGRSNIRMLLENSTVTISKAFSGARVSLFLSGDFCNELFISGYKQSKQVVNNFINNHSLVGKALKTQTDIFVADISAEIQREMLNPDTISSITTLLKSENSILGFLNIEHKKTLDSEHFEIAKELAQELSIGIARAQLFEQVKQSESKLMLLAKNSRDIISLHSIDGKFIYISPSVETILGYKAEELLGKPYRNNIHPDDINKLRQYELKLRNSEVSMDNAAISYRKKHKSGKYVWLETVLGYTHDDKGNINGFVASSREVGRRKEMELELRKLALFDKLTGLSNKTLLINRIEHAIQRNSRRQASFALILFDIDRFKPINDSFGHEIGDKLLIEVATRIKNILRDGDTAARLGGDEYCILVEDLNSEAEAIDIMLRIQKAINEQVFVFADVDISISASFGLAFNSGGYESARALLSDADTAMYEAKKNKSADGSYAIFNQAMRKKSFELLKTDSALRKAIENNEFRMVYQPIIELRTNRLKGFEALLRWENSNGNCITRPDYFIPVAEANDYIKVIDNWVLNTVAKQVADWNNNFDMHDISVSINISPNTFEMPSFPYKLDEVIMANNIKKNNLSLELTERTIMQAPGKGLAVLEMLQARGIKIYIDDFGTGYSSLNYLHKLKFDVLKIDKSFINLIGDNSNKAIVKTIIKLAQQLNLKTIAEGVETKDQLATLIELGCDYGQGWFFSKGLEPSEVEKYYLKNDMVLNQLIL